MKNWNVTVENNVYTFYDLNKETFGEGIGKITIYVKPQYEYSEVHARTLNEKTYRNILNVGKEHALENSSKSSNAKQKIYYFDSSYDTFDGKDSNLLERFFSTPFLMMNYLENSLCRINPFKDNVSGIFNIEKSLTVLAKADKNVEEIIEFMEGISLQYKCIKLIGNNSLFSYTAQDAKYNLNTLSSDLKEKVALFKN